MKIFGALLLTIGLFTAGYSINYDDLSPAKRSELASAWLDAAKAYTAAWKDSNSSIKKARAKNGFLQTISVYPMGSDAGEARLLLKQYFNINLPYNAEQTYSEFLKSAFLSTNDIMKLNLYLMALEIKQDKTVLQNAALLYKKTGQNDKSAEYLQKAVAAGLKDSEIDPALK